MGRYSLTEKVYVWPSFRAFLCGEHILDRALLLSEPSIAPEHDLLVHLLCTRSPSCAVSVPDGEPASC